MNPRFRFDCNLFRVDHHDEGGLFILFNFFNGKIFTTKRRDIIEDKRNLLKEEQPFSYKKTKDKKAMIYWFNKQVMIIKGKDFKKLEQKEQSEDEYTMQLFLAKLTGNFKHGNEKKDERSYKDSDSKKSH